VPGNLPNVREDADRGSEPEFSIKKAYANLYYQPAAVHHSYAEEDPSAFMRKEISETIPRIHSGHPKNVGQIVADDRLSPNMLDSQGNRLPAAPGISRAEFGALGMSGINQYYQDIDPEFLGTQLQVNSLKNAEPPPTGPYVLRNRTHPPVIPSQGEQIIDGALNPDDLLLEMARRAGIL
jgi:hypothetical protein